MPLKTSLKDNKLHMKAKLRFASSRNSGNGVGNMDGKRKGVERTKKVQSRGNSGGNGDCVDRIKSSSGKRSSNLRKKDGPREVGNEGFMLSSGKRSVKSRTRNERKEFGNEGLMSSSGKRSAKSRMKDERKEVRNEGFKSENMNKKRKRVYADQSLENVEISNWDSLRKVAEKKLKEYVGNGKQTTKAKTRNSEQSAVGSAKAERMKSRGSESVDKKNLRGLSKLKAVDKVEDAERSDKGISERRQQLDQNQSKRGADILKRSTKKKVQGKKSTGDDAEEREQKPKKKKRVIRLDPYDTSNKRLDDGLATKDGEEKKKDLPKTSNVELSKNAQFRAICPSPSILSFVEDNLLGRRREIEFKRAGYNIELSGPLDNIPFSTSSERERIEEPVFRNKLSFFAAAKVSSSFPPPDLPEIAFAGRSNVGKSSLLNSLTRQWGVVRTSDKPGLTQTINFFELGSKLCLVDLPGYGFAFAKEEVKEAWEELVKEYVSTRVGLKRVCLLVDTKWGMKPRDYELVDLMERSQTKYQVVLTKTDLVFPIDVARRAMQIEESLKQKKSAVQPVMMVSSKSGAGIRSLRTVLTKIARFVKP